ncbi:MAG: hypothetical protein ACLUVX_08435 [Lachnospira pectinoschiza]
MNIDEKINEIKNHLHNLYEDADRTYTRHEDADMVIKVTAKQLKEYEDLLTKLKKYKDMEAAGKLTKLPYKEKGMNIDEVIQLFRFNNKHVADLSSDDLIQISDLLEELKKYKALEAEDKLIKLNCKVGDTIWYVEEDDDDYPIKLEIDTISRNDNYTWYYAYDDDGGKYGFIDSDFGETVFFTKEEAEMKLRQITENKITKTPKPEDDWVMAR